MKATLIRCKFRGCLLGSLLGDCLGSPYEGKIMSCGDKVVVQKYFDKLEDPTYSGLFRKYTDDTAMMKNVGRYLIDKPEPDYRYLAKLFANEYFEQPRRGYGQNVVDIFCKLKDTKFKNVYAPAQEQFDGSGSYGNGGAMRIAPIALFFSNNYSLMVEAAVKATHLTHTHILGVNGAILQCLAVHKALLSDPTEGINPETFLNYLYDNIGLLESKADLGINKTNVTKNPYQEKIKTIKLLLEQEYHDELDEEVIFMLGNGISAYESVPTAIYCFLRAQRDIPHIKCASVYRRTIQYAITLGGDTDTIACMAGAIAGAFLGEHDINKHLVRHCESNEEIVELADKLFEEHQNH